jgi:hypothetical protein
VVRLFDVYKSRAGPMYDNKALFMLYVTGKAIQIPKIREPTQEDIDKYHKIYVEEVVRLFDAYKSRAGPMYDNKQ